ncbi:hypothetical protein BH11CYA1_BH11CYA1_50400 [soil metagenome]
MDLSEIDDRYFDDEFKVSIDFALMPLAPLVWLGMYITGKGKKTDLLVGDLLTAAIAGYWRHPDREPKFPWQRLRKHANKFRA